MKFSLIIRVYITLFTLVVWLVLSHYLFAPAFVLGRNAAAVASVNGGDAAFYAQRSLERAASFPIILAGVVAILSAIWIGPILKAINHTNKPENKTP